MLVFDVRSDYCDQRTEESADSKKKLQQSIAHVSFNSLLSLQW
ncbi:unnamed protein product [Gongylonema pulchrum]|uniref:Uncharacterized protein n=1 Tax=Gongylonema pulchrum TaxID=637853 RepID=A0A183EIK1_9BILA|nr:unnamed protein product [Gongylonema pulchrum]